MPNKSLDYMIFGRNIVILPSSFSFDPFALIVPLDSSCSKRYSRQWMKVTQDWIRVHETRLSLAWKRCFDIILGIAWSVCISTKISYYKLFTEILKQSNILLYTNLNPKISDFNMIKIFHRNEKEAKKRRIVGT